MTLHVWHIHRPVNSLIQIPWNSERTRPGPGMAKGKRGEKKWFFNSASWETAAWVTQIASFPSEPVRVRKRQEQGRWRAQPHGREGWCWALRHHGWLGQSHCHPYLDRWGTAHVLPPCRRYERFGPEQVSTGTCRHLPCQEEIPGSAHALLLVTAALQAQPSPSLGNKRQYLPLPLPSGPQQLISAPRAAAHCVITLYVNPMCQWAT